MAEIIELSEDIKQSSLYSEDLAPVPASGRTWNMWNLTAIWIGMAVCIPTYILASYMIKSGLDWIEALVIIFIANVIVTIPMVFNGHAGMKYGVPFPVLGRAAFGVYGVHIPSILRALVACGWFGIQTWIGGLAIYAIWCALTGIEMTVTLSLGKFMGFGLFWLMNIYFIWKGTESIRWLETFSAPILILMGLILIGWGAYKGGGFSAVLAQSGQLEKPAAQLNEAGELILTPLTLVDGTLKADQWRVTNGDQIEAVSWRDLQKDQLHFSLSSLGINAESPVSVQFRKGEALSSIVVADLNTAPDAKWRVYLLWLTAMVGFWATMSISISDITRYARSQREQVMGQFLGLPGTMLLYSFVGVFVTCAALIGFDDILVAKDAPWDPVSLLSRFKSPVVVIVAQFFMIIATLSTNIAANVIAPANAFANAWPRKLSFRKGGVITGLVGIVIMPWWLLDHISGLLILVSGFLGPILGVLLADYFFIRRTKLSLSDLFKLKGCYSYTSGFNPAAIVALVIGVAVALTGYFFPALRILYTLSWFTGFATAFAVYIAMMPKPVQSE